MPILAIDIGREGAAVLLTDGGLRCVAGWSVLPTSQMRATETLTLLVWRPDAPPLRLPGFPTPYRLGLALRGALAAIPGDPWLLVVEDVYLGLDPRGAVNQAWFGGALSAPLEIGAVGAPVRVLATTWRPQWLGWRPVGRDAAKQATADGLPAGIADQVAAAVAIVGCAEHVHDATGMALWAAGRNIQAGAHHVRKKRRKKRVKPE